MTILECQDLSVRFATETGEIAAVTNLSFSLAAGECLGIVGESGSGKSQTFLALLGLLAANGSASGSGQFHGRELIGMPRSELDEIRGDRISMVFQDALSGLTPTMRIGDQLAETLMRHKGLNRRESRMRALEALEQVNIPDAASRMRAFPFELSGGMRQRVMIAIAMICRPEILVADEPTTALDVTVQAQILRLLNGLKQHAGTSIVMITHDLAVVAGLCDRVIIMYGGRAVEIGNTHDIFRRAQHPYTRGLLRSMPSMVVDPDIDLPTIAGQPPNAQNMPAGCAFSDRCEHAMPICRERQPELESAGTGHLRACHLEATS